MKSFTQFLSEAVKTTASTQAKQRGLVGDGHGGWYDKKGKFQAKTVSGKLKFVGGAGGKDEEEPKQGGPAKPAETKKKKSAAAAPAPKTKQPKQAEKEKPVKKSPEPGESGAQSAEIMGEPTSEGVVICFGRFNPPTIGHEKLIKAAATEAKRAQFDLRVYPSRSVDAKKNPLQPGAKIEYMEKFFADALSGYDDAIKDDANARTIFDVMTACDSLGYKNLTIVVGSDRLSEFQSLSHKYNTTEDNPEGLYQFDEIKVISGGSRDADSDDDLEGMSASKMRKAAVENDFKKFAKGIPGTSNDEKRKLFNLVAKSMGVDHKETAKRYGGTYDEVWNYAPKLDRFGLRVAYLKEQIFKVGSLVENNNTGESGRITRRGTNYVICMTPEGTMFKSWLTDLNEAYDVGTDEYRAYVQKSTPGQSVRKWNADPIIKPITTGSYWDGKKKKKPEDPSSGPGVKYGDTCKPYKVGKG